MATETVLAINPGSTSTKLAVFRGEEKLFGKNLSHSAEELAPFHRIVEQRDFRFHAILTFLQENSFDPKNLDAVVGRGGLLPPLESGTYEVNIEMLEALQTARLEHASNLGAGLARDVAAIAGVPALIVDPVVVDEMVEEARVTGIPEIRRVSIFHALNQKAAARLAAQQLNKKYQDCNLIVVHLGGGISVGAHRQGRVIDVNNALNGDGPFAPERAGSLPAWGLLEWAQQHQFDLAKLRKKLTGQGGIVAHLAINDMRQVEELVKKGDAGVTAIYRAMAYNVAKWIGAMAVVLEGRIDATVLTGGIAYDKLFISWIQEKIDFLAPVIVLPGEDEMTALCQGALRVLRGEEPAKQWTNPGGNL